MVRMVLTQLRHHVGRTLALLVAIVLATTSFTLLTGSADVSRLEVRGTVDANFRSAYDLLIRPASSYTPLETDQGLVRPNYQSGIFGGISADQLAAIRGLPSVEAAAPVANIGYFLMGGGFSVPLEPYLNGDTQQLFRIRPTWITDRGLSRFVGAPSYVYVSSHSAVVLKKVPYRRGDEALRSTPTYAERVPGTNRPVPVCTNYEVDRSSRGATPAHDTPFGYRDPYAASGPSMQCFYLKTTPRAEGDVQGADDPAHVGGGVAMPLPVLLAAVDPVAENQLSGLDRAVVTGRPLTASDTATRDAFGNPAIPVVAALGIDTDERASAVIERVSPTRGKRLSDLMAEDAGLVHRLATLPGRRIAEKSGDAATSYEELVDHFAGNDVGLMIGNYWSVGSTEYKGSRTSLTVRSRQNSPSVYTQSGTVDAIPAASDDTAVRSVTGHGLRLNQQDYAGLRVVGRYDPAQVNGPGGLSGLTSETYATTALPGADPASVRALDGQSLGPTSNLGGYSAQAPTLLTTMAAAGPLLDSERFEGASSDAPISVVRVRVRDVHGTDPVSRERLNQTALAIADRTGLAVDIVAGASGVATTVVLPAGQHGRPELRLLEEWARKGVAYQVIDAVDRKSVALFVLILTVCSLVVANAASAAVRTRRVELGVLACLGWGAGGLFGVVLAEMAVTGLVAGVLGALAAVPLAYALALDVTWSRALLAVSAATLLAVLAGLMPAVRAARAQPVDAVRPLVHAPGRARPVRSVAGMAVQGLRRVPGRTVLAAASLAIGIVAMTVLLAVQKAFSGSVVGSLLGNAVVVQVRSPDVAALIAVLVLGAAGVANVLYLAIREQGAELAALRATGWTDSALSRLVLHQGLGIGILGGLSGAVLGLATVIAFTGTLSAAEVLSASIAAACGPVLAAIAGLIPAVLVRRLPTAALLADEAG